MKETDGRQDSCSATIRSLQQDWLCGGNKLWWQIFPEGTKKMINNK